MRTGASLPERKSGADVSAEGMGGVQGATVFVWQSIIQCQGHQSIIQFQVQYLERCLVLHRTGYQL